jgi:predicted TIM-barrel fold metal-dependent hydrolase
MTLQKFMQLIEWVESDELFLFSTDYPHWDFDSPYEALPLGIPVELKRKIFAENAASVYTRLPALVG